MNLAASTTVSQRLFNFDNTYSHELPGFYVAWEPEAVPKPELLRLNHVLAGELGVDPDLLGSPTGIAALGGNLVPDGAEPLAQAYAGHPLGGFSPELGVGRALLLGEVIDRYGRRRDIALKGSGRTPFSRNGDGKCALGPALREYLVSEAMAALDIPTTRALAVVTTGEMIRRDHPLPGAVLTRVASSHIRVGTFEFMAAHRGPRQVQQLADYVIARHYPALADHPQAALALLEAVAGRQAELIAGWQGVGFIHGVMNTDNMAVSGETIDYGPCAFLEAYDPATVFSSIDRDGRYAYGQQAAIGQWNLARLAETLLPLIDPDSDRAVELATSVIEGFSDRHAACWLTVMRRKLGLGDGGNAGEDRIMAEDYLQLLLRHRADFTLGFRALFDSASGRHGSLRQLFGDNDALLSAWLKRWKVRRSDDGPAPMTVMQRANPCYIPRNHLLEQALEAAVYRQDMQPFDALLRVVRRPFDLRPEDGFYAEPASPEITAGYRTFCGT